MTEWCVWAVSMGAVVLVFWLVVTRPPLRCFVCKNRRDGGQRCRVCELLDE